MTRSGAANRALLSTLWLFASAPSSAQTAASPENIRLSDGTYSEEPHLVVDGQGRVFAVWKEPVAGCLDPLVFARSLDGGRTWSKGLMAMLYPSGPFGDGHSDPWLTVDEWNRVYCVRDEGYFETASCEGGPNLINVSRSDDGGVTWGPIVDASSGTGPDKPAIENDGNGAVYLTYMDYGREPWKILLRRSDDGGATWSPPKVVGDGSSSVIAARPDGKVFVAWVGFGAIQLAASPDRGETWSNPVTVNPLLDPNPREWDYHVPTRQPIPSAVTDSSGRVFVAWSDRATGDSDILICRSENDGATWSAPVRINDSPAGDQWSVMIAIDVNDILHAAWYDTRDGHMNLYYSFSMDGGRAWSPNLRVMPQDFETRRLGEYFGLDVDQVGAAYLVWTGAEGVPTVGPTWQNPRYIYFARTEPVSRPGPCVVGPDTLCLNDGRFKVQVDWRVTSQGRSGRGTAVPLTGDTGYFWFFDSGNVELVVKALDGRSLNDHFWLFYGALSGVQYTMTVTDTQTGTSRSYFNPSGTLASVADTSAFSAIVAKPGQARLARLGATRGTEGLAAAELYAGLSPAAPAQTVQAAACTPGAKTLCLNQGRFEVQVDWNVPSQGRSGSGMAVPVTADTGYLWFFSETNVELIVKVLDGRPVNGHFWVFYGALSNVQYTIRVTDTETGAIKTYENPSGTLASHADIAAF